MKIQFKNARVTDGENVWVVSGYWNTESHQFAVSRVEGDMSSDGLSAALYNLAVDKGWL